MLLNRFWSPLVPPVRTTLQDKVSESFRGCDAGVLAELPLFLQASFPFLLTSNVVNELTSNVVHSKTFTASAEALRQAHLTRYHDCELKYYNKVLWDKQTPSVSEAQTIEEFSDFGDPQGHNGFSSSDHYLKDVWFEVQQNRPVTRLDPLVKGVAGEVCKS